MKVGHCKAPVKASEHEEKKINDEMNEGRIEIRYQSLPVQQNGRIQRDWKLSDMLITVSSSAILRCL